MTGCLASGGGYDINLVAMDAALNRGWSAEGARFRAMERLAAAQPGTLFFVRPIYADDSARPQRFEVGVQNGNELLVEAFLNQDTRPNAMSLAALRHTQAFSLAAAVVSDCIDLTVARDALFQRAWRSGPRSLDVRERNGIAGVTGHIAESVTEVLLVELGWHALWHFPGPGRHGVDLVFLAPSDKVVAIEVKGTLVAGRLPRLSRRELAQMSAAWIDGADNPGMAELGLQSTDVYGGVVTINFADMLWRVALTADFETLLPVPDTEAIRDVTWLQ